MSPLRLPLATFLFFSGFAAAQIYAPTCSAASRWTANSLDQNPCMVAEYLMGTCSGGSVTIDALPPGSSYLGPSGADDSNLCICNTVTYSLLSACSACQGADLISWSEYSSTCTKTMPPSSFPHPIPSGTRVPQWALIDITSEDMWDANKASAVGASPEKAPGTRIGTPKSSSNTDVIVGGAAGGVATISLVAIVIGLYLRRRRREASAPVAPPAVGASQVPMDEIQPLTVDGYASSTPGTIGSLSAPGTSLVPMSSNDLNYPPTFPGYQGVPQTPAASPQGAVPSLNGSTNSLATMQTSRQQGYHGLLTV